MPTSADKTKILVWDAPTRVFHWLLALSFAGAYITSESDRLIGVHLTLGYTMVGLVAFRGVWGLIGTRYARFASFIRGPQAVTRYASNLMSGATEHHVGHNPMGAVSIVVMLLASLLVVYTGWVYLNNGAHSVKEIHEGVAGFLLVVVGIHMAAVLVGSLTQGENLIGAMLHGHKQGQAKDGIRWSWWPIALVVLAGVLAFWYLQWQAPPPNRANEGRYGFQSRNSHDSHDNHHRASRQSGSFWQDDDD